MNGFVLSYSSFCLFPDALGAIPFLFPRAFGWEIVLVKIPNLVQDQLVGRLLKVILQANVLPRIVLDNVKGHVVVHQTAFQFLEMDVIAGSPIVGFVVHNVLLVGELELDAAGDPKGLLRKHVVDFGLKFRFDFLQQMLVQQQRYVRGNLAAFSVAVFLIEQFGHISQGLAEEILSCVSPFGSPPGLPQDIMILIRQDGTQFQLLPNRKIVIQIQKSVAQTGNVHERPFDGS